MTTSNVAIPVGPSILIGSPDRRTAELLTQILESWRYQVEVVSSGGEALRRLEGALPPGIALLDGGLSDPSGLELMRRLNMGPEQRRTWTILMAQGGRKTVRTSLDGGFDDLLAMPAEAVDLKLRIRVAERVRGLMGQVQKQTAELRYQSTHDGLTGLWNREALLSLIYRETDRSQRMRTDLSLMLLDLDDFSRINHDFSYEAGDRLLAGVASRFRRELRSYDLIGRCGEDEFLLAMPGCTRECALMLAERIRETILGRPFALMNETVTLTASFGISMSRGRSPVVVLREAELALAEAKLAGKNCARVCSVPDLLAAEPLLMDGRTESELKAG